MSNSKVNVIIDKLIQQYISALLTKNDLKLIDLIFLNKPTQEELDNFLSTYDIEVAGGFKSLMLSYFMKMNPDLNFTKYETPRLKGLFNFYRFHNMKLLSYFMKIGKIFKENGISMLILKGFAMKYLRPEFSRAMGDIDILVPEKDYLKTIEISKQLGYRIDFSSVHSIDLHEPSSDDGIMDIHRYINMNNKKGRPLSKALLKRAKKACFNGIDILVPTYEDLFFLCLINLAHNLKSKTSKASTLYVLFDCKYLLEQPDFDWNIVIQNIKLTNTFKEVAFAIKFINTIVPNLIPSSFAKHKMLQKNINDICIPIAFEKYFKALQIVVRQIKIKDAFKSPKSLFRYIMIKLYYKYCKHIVNKKNVLIKLFFLQLRELKKANKKLI